MLLLQQEVRTHLASSAVGTIGYSLFYQLPDSPPTAIAVNATGGSPGTGPVTIRRPTFQVLCRAQRKVTAATNATSVFGVLHGRWNVLATIKGRIVADHEVGPYYRDANNNFVYTLNFGIFTVASTI
jgi:hypothetical protein